LDKSRIYNNWPLAREGFPFVYVGCALILLFSYLGLFFAGLLATITTLFVIFFFRDPDRKNDVEQNAVLTPADGKILEVRHFQDTDNPLGEPFVKVSIFMSIFNVHVNRIPIGGIIEKITYRPGKFFSANLDKASKYNENNMITLKTSDSRKIVFIQIAGIIARRIACWIEEGERVQAGQRFGLIRFGSRLEVYLPVDSHISVSLDQKVKAGKTIIGYLS
jgi:phosphatidylserine decarboxylase